MAKSQEKDEGLSPLTFVLLRTAAAAAFLLPFLAGMDLPGLVLDAVGLAPRSPRGVHLSRARLLAAASLVTTLPRLARQPSSVYTSLLPDEMAGVVAYLLLDMLALLLARRQTAGAAVGNMELLGMAVLLAAAAMTAVAVHQTTRKRDTLAMSGLWAHVRHVDCMGELLMWTGYGLVCGSALFYIAPLILLLYILYAYIPGVEFARKQQLGMPYVQYVRRVQGKLLPSIL